MAKRLLTLGKYAQWTGTKHYSNRVIVRDSDTVPYWAPAGATSVEWDWDGLTDTPAGAGAYSTGGERAECAVGAPPGGYVEKGVYVWKFDLMVAPETVNPLDQDWNYIMQHRGNAGSPPIPSPALAIYGQQLYLRCNTGAGGGFFLIGDLDEGNWHSYEVGYCWSQYANVGWIEVRRDGVTVIARRSVKTSNGTSGGATVRFGAGYRDPTIDGRVHVYWHDLRLDDDFTEVTPPPPPDGGDPCAAVKAQLVQAEQDRALLRAQVLDLNDQLTVARATADVYAAKITAAKAALA